jgi:hypothetical protein
MLNLLETCRDPLHQLPPLVVLHPHFSSQPVLVMHTKAFNLNHNHHNHHYHHRL